jgi:hypothetical protein
MPAHSSRPSLRYTCHHPALQSLQLPCLSWTSMVTEIWTPCTQPATAAPGMLLPLRLRYMACMVMRLVLRHAHSVLISHVRNVTSPARSSRLSSTSFCWIFQRNDQQRNQRRSLVAVSTAALETGRWAYSKRHIMSTLRHYAVCIH